MRKYCFLSLLVIAVLLVVGCQAKPQNEKISSDPVKVPSANKSEKKETVPKVQAENKPSQSEIKSPSRSWYFTRNNQHLAPVSNKDIQSLLNENQAIYLASSENKKIYLSFDCGYELGYTPTILDILQRQQIKAAFFITGQYIKTKPDLVKRMQAEGHLVCNHTWNHPDLATVKQDKLKQEITSLEAAYAELTGVPMDKYIRPPMGNYSADSLKWTKELGYTTVFWSMAWKDWDPQQQPGADYVYQHVLNNIHPGAIILMHAVSASDTEALEKTITDLKAQGYVFSTFSN